MRGKADEGLGGLPELLAQAEGLQAAGKARPARLISSQGSGRSRGLSEVNLRSDAPRLQFLPAESCHSLSRRISPEYSSHTSKAPSPLVNPLNIFKGPAAC